MGAAKQKPQNVIFILCDQLRKDWLACYGHPSIRTPHLDALAAGGLRCQHNIVANPICMPNRMSMLSGQHAHNHGLWTNGLLLDPLPKTVANHLAKQGFHTASIGKIHLTPTGGDQRSWESKKYWAEKRDAGQSAYHDTGPYAGFDHVELTIGHGGSMSAHYEQWYRERGGSDEDLMLQKDPGLPEACGVRSLAVELHPTTFVAERSAAYLRQKAADQQPFFLHVSFPDPHHPFDPPKSAADLVDPNLEPAPLPARVDDRPAHYADKRDGRWARKGRRNTAHHPGGIAPEHIRTMRARTTAMVQMIDNAVGQLMDVVQETGLSDDTLLIFTSDHGDALGDHGIIGKGPWSYRSIIETPLIIHGPGVAVGTSEAVISDIDLAPSICAMLGLNPPPFADGLDQSGHWRDPTSTCPRSAALVEYRNGFGKADYACAGLVGSDWTYLRYQDGAEELTDLAQDPDEQHNLAASQAERCASLRCQLLDTLLASQAKGPAQVSHA